MTLHFVIIRINYVYRTTGIATIIPDNYISGCKKWAIKYNESDLMDFLTLD